MVTKKRKIELSILMRNFFSPFRRTDGGVRHGNPSVQFGVIGTEWSGIDARGGHAIPFQATYADGDGITQIRRRTPRTSGESTAADCADERLLRTSIEMELKKKRCL